METITLLDHFGTPSLLLASDSLNSLVAVILNSEHMVFCQILFINVQTKFLSQAKLASMVKTDDSPPHNKQGKTSLCISSIAFTRDDAFLLLFFSKGAVGILPRLGSALIKIFNPTISYLHRSHSLWE